MKLIEQILTVGYRSESKDYADKDTNGFCIWDAGTEHKRLRGARSAGHARELIDAMES